MWFLSPCGLLSMHCFLRTSNGWLSLAAASSAFLFLDVPLMSAFYPRPRGSFTFQLRHIGTRDWCVAAMDELSNVAFGYLAFYGYVVFVWA